MSETKGGVNDMPRGNGMGPTGAGPMTGRGLGPCATGNTVNYGAGYGRDLGLGLANRRGLGRGFGRSVVFNQPSDEVLKEQLKEQQEILKKQLEAIDGQLKKL